MGLPVASTPFSTLSSEEELLRLKAATQDEPQHASIQRQRRLSSLEQELKQHMCQHHGHTGRYGHADQLLHISRQRLR